MYNYPLTIQKAAWVLDECQPGWHNRIDTERLDLNSVGVCILGQLFGQYERGMGMLFRIDPGFRSPAASEGRSYFLDNVFGAYASKEDWIGEINNRLIKTT